MAEKRLSKSRYMNGLQCKRYLWLAHNQPERIPQPDPGTQHRFDQGRLVGEYARKLFPDGINLEERSPDAGLKKTQSALVLNKTCFEPGVGDERVYSRLDILLPAGMGGWDIIEVKSSTKVKNEYLDDVAFQKHCCTKMGLHIRNTGIMNINKDYVRQGEIDPQQLFAVEDVTEKVNMTSIGIEDRIKEMLETVALPECPDAFISPGCEHPYECPLLAECWDFLPQPNIFDLHYGGTKCYQLFNAGILTVKDIPHTVSLNQKQQIQKNCEISGTPHIDINEIRAFLNTLKYPLYLLDFETFDPAIPPYDVTSPFEVIPFQFSLHVAEARHAVPQHLSFLADGRGDPRPALIAELKRSIGIKGSIVAYTGYEDGILKGLGNSFSKDNSWLEGLRSRMVDLYGHFKDFHYYHPAQRGSASLKSVLPALTGKGYEGMNIKDGVEASLAYLDIISGELTPKEEQKLRQDLLDYCQLDTLGMAEIIERLYDMAA